MIMDITTLDAEKQKALRRLQKLWVHHDKVERAIIKLERRFSDEELDTLLEPDEA
jgi:hypothetical protein